MVRCPVNVVWCEYWDHDIDEPGGVMRDLGECEMSEFPAVRDAAREEARLEGWGPGDAYATDECGRLINSRPTYPSVWVGLN